MSGADLQPPTGNAGDDTQAREQRIAALRSLANAQSPTVSPDAADNVAKSKRGRRLPVLLAALVVIVLLTTAGAAWRGWLPWQRATNAKPVSINLASDNLHCPLAAVWSADSHQIAVLAQLGACAHTDAGLVAPNVVAIFDTQGHVVRLLRPDSLMLGSDTQATPAPTPANGVAPTTIPSSVQYFALGWSPDGRQVALVYQTTFAHDAAAPIEKIAFESGVALLPADGGEGEKLVGYLQSGFDTWDLQTRKVIHNSSVAQSAALAYQWSPNGQITPAGGSAADARIGDPSLGERFTIWQAGHVFLDRAKGALSFSAGTMAWSSDGRYLAPYLGFGCELAPQAQGIIRLSDGACQAPYRDKALVIAASRLKSPDDPYASFIPAAWRGDGRLLAAEEPNPLIDIAVQTGESALRDATEHIVIYDSATGAKRLTLSAHLPPNPLQPASSQSQSLLRWAPAGQTLFLLDTMFDSITIWDLPLN